MLAPLTERVKDPSATLDQRGEIDTPISGGEIVGDQAVDVRNYVKSIVLALSAQLTPQAKNYEVFLTADYAQFASTVAWTIRFITQIPPEAMAIARELVQK
ncbi:hypothetical protein NIES4071_42090 [Calothrix sp. NIES-4071]|nr:hypothetical protein NIES4071_42090 [Calothrix sp. NIES-4071]BAZ58522.1 hypothetical protein NIES4105_42010 [Calothrix sp. NIES-4105]